MKDSPSLRLIGLFCPVLSRPLRSVLFACPDYAFATLQAIGACLHDGSRSVQACYTVDMPELPIELREAIERGALTRAQLAQLIALEAEAIGLTAEEAVARAHAGTLPRHYIADDLALLVEMQAVA